MKKKIGFIVAICLVMTMFCLSIGLGVYYQWLDNERINRENILKMFADYYDYKVAAFKEENETLSDVDVAFLGDSLTDGYDVKSYYPQYVTANRGIGGDTTYGLERRLDCSAYDINPKVIVMLIGINNIDTMLENYERIVTSLETNLPSSKIILLSLTSMTLEWGRNNEKAKSRNIVIQDIAQRHNCTFIDLYSVLLDPNTNELRMEYTVDGGHFTAKGYEVITNTITPYLQALLGK